MLDTHRNTQDRVGDTSWPTSFSAIQTHRTGKLKLVVRVFVNKVKVKSPTYPNFRHRTQNQHINTAFSSRFVFFFPPSLSLSPATSSRKFPLSQRVQKLPARCHGPSSTSNCPIKAAEVKTLAQKCRGLCGRSERELIAAAAVPVSWGRGVCACVYPQPFARLGLP